MRNPAYRFVRWPDTAKEKKEFAMLNLNNKKKNQRISAVIVILLVLAMIVPLVTSMFV